jgi:cell division transport system ATP-binding protein
MIELFHVDKSYIKGKPALSDVTLRVEKGEFIFVVGPSGAGKTTLLKLLFCMEHPDAGQILIQGRNIGKLTNTSIQYLRRNMGFIFQDFKLLENKTVFDNVALPLLVKGAGASEIRKKVSEVLRMVRLDYKKDQFPPLLSGGEQQRVAIARAIINEPMVLLADEPTGNLDSASAKDIFDLLEKIHMRGTAMVIATHNADIVNRMKKRVIALVDGKVVNE